MEFWLSFNNGAEKLWLPVPPADFEMKTGNNNTVLNINDLGEINLIGKRKLISIGISSFFPAQEYPFCQYRGFPEPYDCVQLIESWRDSTRPIRLLVTDTNINHPMVIETFDYGERDGTRDIYFTLELKEYRFLNVSDGSTSLNSQSYGIKPRQSEKTPPSSYVVKTGDTLSHIAKRVYGDSSKWNAIAQKNSINDPRKLQIGQTLVI